MANRVSALQFFSAKKNPNEKKTEKQLTASASPSAKRRRTFDDRDLFKEHSSVNKTHASPQRNRGVNAIPPQQSPMKMDMSSKKRKRNKKNKYKNLEVKEAPTIMKKPLSSEDDEDTDTLLHHLVEEPVSESEDAADVTWRNESVVKKKKDKTQHYRDKKSSPCKFIDLDETSEDEEEGSSDQAMEGDSYFIDDEDDELTGSDLPIQPMEAAKMLAMQIMGKDLNVFFKEVFGQRCVLLPGSLERPLHLWYNSEIIFGTLRDERLIVGEDVHLTKFENGEKVSLEEGSVAYPCLLKDMMMEEGCTIRLTQPHRYHRPLASRLSMLQELFGSAMGCNAYFTPGQSQGFAPHYDDIDAFVLQLEGSKHWRVYKPRNPSEAFDLKSSGDFTMEDIAHCELVIDATLHPGDVLYMPRSYVHHAFANGDEASLHLTISTYQNTSWFNLLDKLLPVALPRFMKANVNLRENLPLGYLTFTGHLYKDMAFNLQMPHSINSNASTSSSSARHGNKSSSSGGVIHALQQRQLLEMKVRTFLHNLADWKHLPIDEACDLLGLDMVRFSMPPVLLPGEERHTVCEASFEPSLQSLVRLTRWSTLRLVTNQQVGFTISPEDQAELEREDAVESIAEPQNGRKSPIPKNKDLVGAPGGVVSTAGKTELPSKKKSRKRERMSSTSSDKDDPTANEQVAERQVECLYHNLLNKFDRTESGSLGNYHLLTKRLATTVKLLLRNYPQYTLVENFPLPDADHKLDAALALYRMGILVAAPGNEGELQYMFDDETEDDEENEEVDSDEVPNLTPIGGGDDSEDDDDDDDEEDDETESD